MMIVTHTALSIAGTALTMGTADPVVLGAAALAAQLSDMDTSKSLPGINRFSSDGKDTH